MKNLSSPRSLDVPFAYSGTLYQTRIHLENILITNSISKNNIWTMWNSIIGKVPLFYTDELMTLEERSVKQTLKGLWEQAEQNGATIALQELVNEVLQQ